MSDQEIVKSSMNPTPGEQANTLADARRGDSDAFSTLTEPHRNELLTHCYRMLGSLEEAEDQVQETFLRAWRRLETYEGRASFRAWLYKIATNACLDALERLPRRTLPGEANAPSAAPDSPPLPILEPVWIQPFPHDWLPNDWLPNVYLAPASANPEARYDAHESISLAFLVALQVLPPRQRSVLILRDVLGWSMAEIAETLGATLPSVTSLVHRARTTLRQRNIAGRQDASRMRMPDAQMRELLEHYVRAWESADIDGIVALLTEDASFPMPPFPLCFVGRPAIRAFLTSTIFTGEAQDLWKLVPITANAQPGFALYRLDANARTYQPFALQVLTLSNELASCVTTFGFPALFPRFNLPPLLMG